MLIIPVAITFNNRPDYNGIGTNSKLLQIRIQARRSTGGRAWASGDGVARADPLPAGKHADEHQRQ